MCMIVYGRYRSLCRFKAPHKVPLGSTLERVSKVMQNQTLCRMENADFKNVLSSIRIKADRMLWPF